MQFTNRFFTSFLVPVVFLLVCVLVSQDSSQTQSDTHGIQVANMDGQ
jgi:hypothetical protein